MTELKLISPMLDHFAVGGSISDHHGIRCYPAMNDATGDKYIVKVISIPASRTQLDAFLLSGAYADEASALVYFKEQAEEVMKEVEILEKLSQLEGFFPYEKAQLVPMDDDVGLNVYLLGSYKHTLERAMQKQPMTHLAAVNLGLDLCAALTVCRRSGYLYADLKPSNIFVTDDNGYRIGDLGLLNMDSLKYASLPDKYRSAYTAPEIADAFSSLNTTIDVYAVGKILYQIYNNGELPTVDPEAPQEPLAAPANADYEMSEIILKACAQNPDDRWEDPAQMGQALVSYMQRNGANDTPIVPPVVPVAETLADESASEDAADEAAVATADETVQNAIEEPSETTTAEAIDTDSEEAAVGVLVETVSTPDNDAEEDNAEPAFATPIVQDDELGSISALLQPSGDETAPENNETDVDYAEVSDEISEILSQADEIANHPVPEPAVAPEPIDVPVPPLPAEEENADVETADAEVENAEGNASEGSTEPTDDKASEATDTAEDADATKAIVVANTDEASEDDDFEDYTDDDFLDAESQPAKKKKPNWLLITIITLLLLGLIAVGAYFYTNYYLLPIDSMTVEGKDDYVTVTVETPVDESLLTVVCKGQHGDILTAPVQNGTATFTGLKDDTGYVISLEVSGFHKLTGEISKGYATPQVTNVSDFKVSIGSVSGSVNVSFTVTGKDASGWQLSYSATGESVKKITLESKSETISGLTVGAEYTFTLEPAEDLYLTGETKIKQTIFEPAYAQHLSVTGCDDKGLSVSWLAPKEIATDGWTVVCTGESDGYSKEINVSANAQTAATFADIDRNLAYTITVTAKGMQNGVTTTKTADAKVLSGAKLDVTESSAAISWDENHDLGALTITYTADGLQIGEAVTTTEGPFTIEGLIPNTVYCITIKCEDGTTPIGGMQAFATNSAEPFKVTFDGVTTTDKDMTFDLCAPKSDKKGWTSENYTTSFEVGQKAGIVIKLTSDHGYSQDEITRVFAIYDKDGKLVSVNATEEQWYNMWWSDSTNNTCHLSIPTMPDEIGEYTLHLYFNGQLVTTQEFTVVE